MKYTFIFLYVSKQFFFFLYLTLFFILTFFPPIHYSFFFASFLILYLLVFLLFIRSRLFSPFHFFIVHSGLTQSIRVNASYDLIRYILPILAYLNISFFLHICYFLLSVEDNYLNGNQKLSWNHLLILTCLIDIFAKLIN